MNRDLLQRALVRPGEPTPMAWLEGVEAQTLECLEPGPAPSGADGVPGRGTWLVEMAPGAHWTWRGGPSDDLFVVRGALREGNRRLPEGTFVRRTSSTTWTSEGATLLVKRLPMLPGAERERTLLPGDGDFEASWARGLHLRVLVDDGPRRTVLLRFDPGTSIGDHRHDRGEELFVWRGHLVDELGTYARGTWLRQPPGSHHRVEAPDGCTLFTVSGHL